MTPSNQALSGIRVLDMTQNHVATFSPMLLADLGAEVIKIEKPQRWGRLAAHGSAVLQRQIGRLPRDGPGPTLTTHLTSLSPGRRSALAADRLRRRAGGELPPTRKLARLGFGYDAVHARNPRPVYCSISAYGQTGPLREQGGFDLVAQAMSGVFSVTGTPEQPAKIDDPMADLNAGLFASHAILAALLARARARRGTTSGGVALEGRAGLHPVGVQRILGRPARRPGGWGRRTASPRPYRSSRRLTARSPWTPRISATGSDWWTRWSGATSWRTPASPVTVSASAHFPALHRDVDRHLQNAHDRRLVRAVRGGGRAVGAGALDIEQVYAHPQVQARQMELAVEHPVAGVVRAIGFPVKYSANPQRLEDGPRPCFGQAQCEHPARSGPQQRGMAGARG